MPIFNEEYTLIALNEMKTREEYARRSFKKKYNFKPDKPGSNVGTVTDQSGKKYRVDMRKSKYIYDDGQSRMKRDTISDLDSENSDIYLSSNKFFKLKGSNKGERRDAVMQHELGHQNLHNINHKNNTVDPKKRTSNVYSTVKRDTNQNPNDVHSSLGRHYYLTSSKASDSDIKKRDSAFKLAGDLAKSSVPSGSTKSIEIEADRYAANRTSEGAMKKALRNAQRNEKVSARKNGDSNSKQNERAHNTYTIRSKALKNKTLRDSDVYK